MKRKRMMRAKKGRMVIELCRVKPTSSRVRTSDHPPTDSSTCDARIRGRTAKRAACPAAAWGKGRFVAAMLALVEGGLEARCPSPPHPSISATTTTAAVVVVISCSLLLDLSSGLRRKRTSLLWRKRIWPSEKRRSERKIDLSSSTNGWRPLIRDRIPNPTHWPDSADSTERNRRSGRGVRKIIHLPVFSPHYPARLLFHTVLTVFVIFFSVPSLFRFLFFPCVSCSSGRYQRES